MENIRELIKDTVELHGNNIAFRIKKENKYIDKKYNDFYEDINNLGSAFLEKGFLNKRIAVIGKNRYEWVITYLAVVNGIGVIVPLDKGLAVSEIENSLIRSKAEVVVFDEKYIDDMKKIKEDNNTEIKHYICMDKNDTFDNLESLMTKRNQEKYKNLPIDNEKMSIIIFTSGTTSKSKAVMLSHKNIASNIEALNKVEESNENDVNMSFLPYHHTFGFTGLLFYLNKGCMNVFCDGLRYIQKNLKEYKVSVFVGVPAILEAMHKKLILEVEKQGKLKKLKMAQKLSKFLMFFGIDIRRKLFKDIINGLGGYIRSVISGAAPIDKKVAKDFNDWGILTIQGYGLTETSPVIAAEDSKHMRAGSVGHEMFNVEVKIDNPNKEGKGEIIAKGPNVMLGYYEDEKATKEVLKNGWFYTGDIGYIDKDGYIFITGRKKNVIVLKNGKNIYPEELETLIGRLPYVEECMVFGKPKEDDYVVSAKVVYNEDRLKEENPKEKIWEDIKNINTTLPNYKHIKNIVVTTEPMAKTTTNKIKRFEEMKKI